GASVRCPRLGGILAAGAGLAERRSDVRRGARAHRAGPGAGVAGGAQLSGRGAPQLAALSGYFLAEYAAPGLGARRLWLAALGAGLPGRAAVAPAQGLARHCRLARAGPAVAAAARRRAGGPGAVAGAPLAARGGCAGAFAPALREVAGAARVATPAR